jgi:hypothetical protein
MPFILPILATIGSALGSVGGAVGSALGSAAGAVGSGLGSAAGALGSGLSALGGGSLATGLGTAAGLGSAGVSIGEQAANGAASRAAESQSLISPASGPTSVNPSLAETAISNQLEQNPYANQGLASQNLSQLFGIGANQPISTGQQQFTPAGVGSGTGNPVTNQGPYYLSDLVNNVMGA